MKCAIDKLNPIFGKMSPVTPQRRAHSFQRVHTALHSLSSPKPPFALYALQCTTHYTQRIIRQSLMFMWAHWALDAEAGWYALCSVQCKALQAVSVQASPFWAQWARAAGRTCLHCHLTHRSDHSQLTRHKI